MSMRRITFVLVLLMVNAFLGIKAQNISTVDVNNLSQSEVEDAKKKLEASGLSEEEAVSLARERGASEDQINVMRQRMQEEGKKDEDIVVVGEVDSSEEEVLSERKSGPEQMSPETKDLGIFGNYLFNSKNLTFEPSVSVQTPSNYELNIGDEVVINIWGNSQSNYQIIVNRNGQIIIPDVGPVFVAGLKFSDAEAKIKERLTSIYADMGGDTPNTFAQVNMGQLHGIRVNIVGEVEMPGTYTLSATATVFNALYLSGGPSSIGSFRNISVIRDNKTYKTIDIYDFLIKADPSGDIILKDNDIIFVPTADKKVSVDGFFKRNAIFELKSDENLADVLEFAGGLTNDAYRKSISIYRKQQNYKQLIDVPEDELSSVIPEDGDVIKNRKVLERFANRVTIMGAVFRPGEYEWTEGFTLNELVRKASGIREDVFENRGIITRLNPDYTLTTIPFDVEKVISGVSPVILQPEDVVTIKSHFDIGENSYVSISGEVMQASIVPWSDSLTVSDLLFTAGGFTEAADSTVIEISRRLSYKEAAQLTDTLVHVFSINHSRDLALGGDEPFYLKPYDQVSVKRAPGFRNQGSVSITGEVVYEGTYALRIKEQRISDLIELAKGATPQAFLPGATLQRRTEELGNELIAIDLEKVLNNPGKENDLILRDGDVLHIPQLTQTVKVNGMVQNPFSLTYEEGKKAKFYINRTGGFDSKALKRKTYVKYPNGYTKSTKSFLGFKSYPKVMAGSTVIVPQKPEKKVGENSGMWLGIASTMATVAVSVATVVSLSQSND